MFSVWFSETHLKPFRMWDHLTHLIPPSQAPNVLPDGPGSPCLQLTFNYKPCSCSQKIHTLQPKHSIHRNANKSRAKAENTDKSCWSAKRKEESWSDFKKAEGTEAARQSSSSEFISSAFIWLNNILLPAETSLQLNFHLLYNKASVKDRTRVSNVNDSGNNTEPEIQTLTMFIQMFRDSGGDVEDFGSAWERRDCRIIQVSI